MDQLEEAVSEFIKAYDYLWIKGGINAVGIGNNCIVVYVESSQEIVDQIPNTFHGFSVVTKIGGEILPL